MPQCQPFRDSLYAACTVVQIVDAGDHDILIGLVEEVQPPSATKEPLVYFRRQYGAVHFEDDL